MPKVFAVNWTEYERGWGNRPDGHTLHLTKEIAEKYIADYWKGMPDEVQDEYSSPGSVLITTVTDEVYAELVERKSMWGHVKEQVPAYLKA